MHERRVVLERLDQVRLDGVLEQSGASTLGLDVGNGDRLAGTAVSHDHATQALLQVVEAGGEAEHGHDLGSDGDVEAVLTGNAVTGGAEAVDHVAQLAVVHVDAAAPNDVVQVDVKLVALLDVVVKHRGDEVVRSTDGMEVAGEVQVDVLHGNDLGVTAASGTALDAEHGAQRRLTQAQHRGLADLAQGVMQTHRRGGLALASRRRVDSRDKDELCLHGLILVGVDVDLRLVVTIGFARGPIDASLLSNLFDGQHLCFLRDLDVGLRHVLSLLMLYSRAFRPSPRKASLPIANEPERAHPPGSVLPYRFVSTFFSRSVSSTTPPGTPSSRPILTGMRPAQLSRRCV